MFLDLLVVDASNDLCRKSHPYCQKQKEYQNIKWMVYVGAHRVLFGAGLPGTVPGRGAAASYCTSCCSCPAGTHGPLHPPGLPKIIRWAPWSVTCQDPVLAFRTATLSALSIDSRVPVALVVSQQFLFACCPIVFRSRFSAVQDRGLCSQGTMLACDS